MSEAGNRTDPEPHAEKSIFEPLLRVKGVVIASMVLAVCVLALDLPFWFRAGLLAVVVLGAVWLSSEVASSESDEAPTKNIVPNEMAGVSGERLADLLTDPMVVFDHGGTVRFANSAALDAFQSLETGTALYLRFRAPEMHALIQGVIADGEARSIEYFERVPMDRWFKAMVKALPDKDGRPELLFCCFAIRVKRGALTACVRISSQMQTMNCARPWHRFAGSSKRCKGQPETIRLRVIDFWISCKNKPNGCHG